MSSSLFTIRPALAGDSLSISSLESRCAQESESYRGSEHLLSSVPLIGHQLSSLLIDANHVVLVVESAGVMCGFAHMEITDSVAMVQRVYVDDRARDLGAGATLIDELRDRARSQGCSRIDAYALPGDRLTKNLFERAGMKARLLIASSDL